MHSLDATHFSSDECWLCLCIGCDRDRNICARIIALVNEIAFETYRHHHLPAMTSRFHYNPCCCHDSIRVHFDVSSVATMMTSTTTTTTHSSKSSVFSCACIRLRCCCHPSSTQFHSRRTYANSDPRQMLLVDWNAFSLVVSENPGNEHTKW